MIAVVEGHSYGLDPLVVEVPGVLVPDLLAGVHGGVCAGGVPAGVELAADDVRVVVRREHREGMLRAGESAVAGEELRGVRGGILSDSSTERRML